MYYDSYKRQNVQGKNMSRSGGMGQLFKGVIIGVVLLLAIVGTMSILDKGKTLTQEKNTPSVEPSNIPAPSINIASSDPTTNDPVVNDPTTQNTTESTPITEEKTDEFKPVLEGEKTAEEKAKEIEKAEEKKAETIKYGVLDLGVINPETKEKLKADYSIYDVNNKKVAETKSVEGSSFKLTIGQYKVVTRLIKPTGTTRDTKPVQTSEILNVTANNTTNHTFELEPPSTLGVLQVSAQNAKNAQAMKATFIVQKENGVTVATRQNVTASLFKLKAGSYKVTVRSGNNSDFRTIVVEPGESSQEVFKLQEAFKLGRVLVRIFDTRNNNPLKADIVIATTNGTTVQELKAVAQTEISLPAANYKIRVTGPNGQSSRRIKVDAGKSISEIFRFDPPVNGVLNEVQITDNVTIRGTVQTAETEQSEEQQPSNEQTQTENTAQQENEQTQSSQGSLKLFARNDSDQRAIKSNFYVQTPNGKHIAKKIYADSAEFTLEPGIYRITVRSKNRSNVVRTIEVSAGQQISQDFSLRKPNSNNQATAPTLATPVLAPPKPAPAVVKNTAIPNGFLSVSMSPARNTHFIVTTKTGKKIVDLSSVPSGRFKLDTGQYVVTAIHNNIRHRQNVQVRSGRTARLVFKAGDFQAPQKNITTLTKGVLRSRIIDRSGRPLRGNLTVTNMRGQVVARANAVTVGVFNLPPEPHTVIVNYQGLRGSERVRINARETTVQTFTISPNNTRENNSNPPNLLRDKIEEDIRKQF